MPEIEATNVVASWPPDGDRLQRRPLVPIKNQFEAGLKNIDSYKKKKRVLTFDVECNINLKGTFCVQRNFDADCTFSK